MPRSGASAVRVAALALSLALAGVVCPAAKATGGAASSFGQGGTAIPGAPSSNPALELPAPPPAPVVVTPPTVVAPLPLPALWRTTLVSPIPRLERYYRWLNRSHVPQPPGPVGFEIGSCSGGNGCIDWRDPPVVRLAPRARRRRSTFYHEIGHLFDYYVLEPSGYRDGFLPLVRRRSYDRLATERFADAYMLCAQSRRLREATVTRSYRYSATPSSHRRACRLIHSVATAWYEQAQHSASLPQPAP